MRELASSYDRFEALGVGAVALVTEGDEESARKLATWAKAPFPVMSDRRPAPGQQSTVHERYGVSYGTVYLLDARGAVRWAFFGDKRTRPRVEVILRQVRRMLAEDADPQAASKASAQVRSASSEDRLQGLETLALLTPPEAFSAVASLLRDGSS